MNKKLPYVHTHVFGSFRGHRPGTKPTHKWLHKAGNVWGRFRFRIGFEAEERPATSNEGRLRHHHTTYAPRLRTTDEPLAPSSRLRRASVILPFPSPLSGVAGLRTRSLGHGCLRFCVVSDLAAAAWRPKQKTTSAESPTDRQLSGNRAPLVPKAALSHATLSFNSEAQVDGTGLDAEEGKSNKI